jgi:hypothetical protein
MSVCLSGALRINAAMAGPKQAPLETYLSSVAEPSQPEAADDKSPDRSLSDGGSAVILTILSQAKGPVSAKDLRDHSELGWERYERTMDRLRADGLVHGDGKAFELTERGRVAAERERSRLLNPW